MLLELEEGVASRAQEALATSPIYSLRGLSVAQDDDVLHISGAVSSFYHKQLAQEAVRAVAGGMRVENEIAVGRK